MKEQKLTTSERIKVNSDWKLIGHSHQIADTGDYDGHYEITNGKISLLTQDDDDEALQPIVDVLNDSGCKFYQDDWFEFENKMLQEDVAGLRERVKELEERLSEERFHTMGFSDALGGANFRLDAMKAENTRLREALEEITRVFGNPISSRIAKEALKQQDNENNSGIRRA